jgi:hypothetical protein
MQGRRIALDIRALAAVGAGLALACATGQASAAGRATAFPPFPTAKGQAAAIQWLLAETNLPLDKVTAVSDSAVFALVEGPSPAPAGGGLLRVRLREEVLNAATAKVVGGRSALMIMHLDCKPRRLRLEALEVYQGSNLQGTLKRQPGGDWMAPPADSYLSDVMAAGCDPGYRYPFVPIARTAAAPSPAAAAPPATPPAAAAALRPSLGATPPARSAPPPPTPTPTPPVPAMAGAYQAQVGAFATAALANEELARLSAAFKAQFAGRAGRVEPTAAQPPRMFRALVDGFASLGDVKAFCAALKASGKPCMARRR